MLEATSFADTSAIPSFSNPNLEKAYRVIVSLRKIAHKLIVLDGDMREYYWTLLFHTLKILQLPHISSSKKEHALLAASLLCQRLDQWPEWDVGLPEIAHPETNVASEEKTPSEESPSDIEAPKSNQIRSKWMMSTALALITIGIPALALLMQVSFFAAVVVFLLVGAMVMTIIWWAMYRFKPNWQSHIATFTYLSLFIIAISGSFGLVSGEIAVDAIREIITTLFN